VGIKPVHYKLGFGVAETQVSINPGQTVTVSPCFTIQVCWAAAAFAPQ
jgi:hypothetical protein